MPFANPMSEAAVNAAMAALPLPADPRLVDAGCGNGEMLVRAVSARAGARGLGVDLDADAIADARRRAADLPVRFEIRDAATLDGCGGWRRSSSTARASGAVPLSRTSSPPLAGRQRMSWPIWTGCARSGARVSRSFTSRSRASATRPDTRRRWRPTPNAMTVRTRSRTRDASVSDARCRVAATPSGSACSRCVVDLLAGLAPYRPVVRPAPARRWLARARS